VIVRPSAELSHEALAELLRVSWPGGVAARFDLDWSLCWASAHVGERLIGFVNVVGDGGAHAFILDTTVHPDFRRHGIGLELVRCAAEEARDRGAEYLHVDFAREHAGFYRRCGFRPTAAGLLRLAQPEHAPEHAPTPAAAEPSAAQSVTLRKYAAGDAPACRALLAGLSDWFAIPAASEAYLADLTRLPTWVATLGAERRVAGFVSLTVPQPRAFEVHVLAVARDLHGRGIGRALMTLAEHWSAEQGARFLQVKTLGPSHTDPFYRKTRSFYAHLGYEALFESDTLWDNGSNGGDGADGNPTVLLVKALDTGNDLRRP
jgi:ribosomal protein S18 acetylase RimI-like enzyme